MAFGDSPVSLATRCPHCATVFRVQPAQLSARGGKVRCGKCTQVFDGVAGLVAPSELGSGEGPTEASPQLALFEAGQAQATEETGSATPAPEPQIAPTEPESPSPPEPAAPAAPAFLAAPAQAPRRTPWVLASLLALLILSAQAAMAFRTELAVLVPQAKPVLAALCAQAGCDIRLPRRPRLLAIESSDLQAEGRRENVIVLNAVLRNQAPFAQEFPALELTLTDEKDEALARRVLRPMDYLGAGAQARLAQGIGASADAALRLYLDTGGLKAVGYRMYLFYP